MDAQIGSDHDQVTAAICETARGLAAAGVLDEAASREFDEYCRVSDECNPASVKSDEIQ